MGHMDGPCGLTVRMGYSMFGNLISAVRLARTRSLMVASALITTAVAVVSYNTSFVSNATGTPEIRQLADSSPINDASSPEEMVMLGTTMIYRAYRTDIGWELWKTDTTVANAQPELVKDINPDGDSRPENLTVWNNKIIFSAVGADIGREVYITDGTSAGTVLVKDINVGTGNSDPGQFRPAGSIAYFTANDGSSGSVLWKTDGTTSGTARVTGIPTSTAGSSPYTMVAAGSQKFFVADDGRYGRELWVTDGTADGAHMVKDIHTGGGQGADQIYGGTANGVYFRGWSPNHGWEMWFSDGTESGTIRLTDVTQGPSDTSFDRFTVVGTRLFFEASDVSCCSAIPSGKTGYEVYVSNGTVAGTRRLTSASPDSPSNQCWWCYRVQEIRALGAGVVTRFNTEFGDVWYRTDGTLSGTASLDPDPTDTIAMGGLTFVGDQAFFQTGSAATGNEPWVTDGSAAGTRSLGDINPTNVGSSAGNFVRFGSPERVIFKANDGVHGEELWITDYTSAGTVMLKDFNTTLDNSSNSYPQNITAAGNRVYFRVYTPATGWELGISDGTTAGSVILDLVPGTNGSNIDQMHGLSNGQLIFRNNDGTNGHEPWITSGTIASTRNLGDFNPTGNTEINSATIVNGTYFLAIHTGDYWSIWSTDGSGSGASRLTGRCDNNGDPDTRELTALTAGVLFRSSDCQYGHRWWTSDGTVAGTSRLVPPNPTSPWSDTTLMPVGGTRVFVRSSSSTGEELWVTDGSIAGTRVMVDINTANNSSNSDYLYKVGNRWIFPADDGVHGRELWATDGTPAGTVMLSDINTTTENGGNSDPQNGTIAGSKIYFRTFDGTRGWELTATDGTVAGTTTFDFTPGRGDSTIDQMTGISNGLVFRVNNGTNGHEPWFSDGTVAGTRNIKDFNPGGGNSEIQWVTSIGPRFLMRIYNNQSPYQWALWGSDGTEAGTAKLAQSCGNGSDANPREIRPLNNGAIFIVENCVNTWHWYRTDGTVAGTGALDPDLSDNNWVQTLHIAGGIAYYVGTDTTSGSELWSTDGSAAGTAIVADVVPGSTGSSPSEFMNVGSRVYFSAQSATEGRELWRTDGTAATTALVKDIAPGTAHSNPAGLTPFNDKVFFSADDGTNGQEPWVSDGTAAGTYMLTDINTSGSSAPDSRYVAGSFMYFRPTNGTERNMWVTDGTVAGTHEVISINPGDDSPNELSVTTAGMFYRRVDSGVTGYFFADRVTGVETRLTTIDPANGAPYVVYQVPLSKAIIFAMHNDPTPNCSWQYWKSDGTVAGTTPLDPIGDDAYCVREGVTAGDKFYFYRTTATGTEIGVVNGATGVITELDVMPQGGTSIDQLALDGGGVRFRADDGVHGREWYLSDGTVAGTRLLADVNTTAAGSAPRNFFSFGGHYYFRAYSPSIGVALWRTDGTIAGTTMVKDVSPLSMDGDIQFAANTVAGKMVLSVHDGNGWELWFSDGTEAGTFRAKDFNTTTTNNGRDEVDNVYVAGNRVFFRAFNGTYLDLWASDGTTAGTVRVDVRPNANDEVDSFLTLGNGVIFRGVTASDGRELHYTDGTPQGTVYLGNIEPGAGDIYFANWSYVKVGRYVIFEVNNRPNNTGLAGAWQWWISDGTAAGTRPFDMDVTNTAEAEGFSVVGANMFFTDDDGSGRKSYKLDGLTGVITEAAAGSVSTVLDNGANSIYTVNDGMNGDEPAMKDSNGSYVLLRNINQIGTSSNASDFVALNGSTYFTADDGTNGREIWKVTGSGAPAIFSTGITNENCCGSMVDSLVVSGSQLFFAAVSTTTRKELYVTDGTVAGTRLVKDINTNNGWCWWCDPYPDNLQALNGKVVFRAGASNNREVWVSDGTSAGTFELANINANGSSEADQFAVLGNRVYFRARGTNGRHQLWSTDGTVAGTGLVYDFNPNGNIEFATGESRGVGNVGLLRVYDYGQYGWQWYVSDSTPSGTRLLDPYPTDGNWPESITIGGQNIFFNASDLSGDRELYVVDQAAVTTRIANFYASGSAHPQNLTVIGGLVYFSQETDLYGREMWQSDGTLAGTTLVTDANRVASATTTEQVRVAGSRAVYRFHSGEWELGVADPVTGSTRIDLRNGGESNPTELNTVGNKVVFSADNGTERQLYVSDGTVAGTQVLLNINTSGNDNVSSLTLLDGRVFFRANDGVTGVELWVTDGTVAGTRRLTDINTGGDSNPTMLHAYGNRLAVSATDGSTGVELYISTDGTTFTFMGDNNPSGDFNPAYVLPLGSGYVFRGFDAVRGQEPWITDGTVSGTRIIADLNPNGSTEMSDMVVINPTKVLFKANDSVSGWEPWVTDGTAAGTVVLDIQTGTDNGGHSDPYGMTAANGRVYMNAFNQDRGRELWVTDGTLAGTTQGDINLAGGRVEEPAAPAGSGVAWGAGNGVTGRELWLSNGTAAGTVQMDLNPGMRRDQGGSYPYRFTPMGSTTYFVARSADDGNELWRTDGTAAGTQMVHDIAAGTLGGNADIYGLAGGRYVARSWSPEYGNELWVSDGTVSGSRLLKDIWVGTRDSNPDDFVMSGGRLFFRADDGVYGREIWVTDGTTAGTRMIKDIFLGNNDAGSDINWPVGSGVVFGQNDGPHGWQYFFTNGTASGTRYLDNNVNAGGSPDLVSKAGDEVFYRLDDGANGQELWAFNGNTGQRRMVKDINPGSGSAQIDNILVSGSRVYFWANDGVNGREIWVSDGTEAGTRMVKDINAGSGDLSADYLTVVGSRLFFRAHNGTQRNLWVTDGTEAGTYEVKDIVPNSDDHMDQAVGGSTKLFFKSWSSNHGWELWISDGTSAGTFEVKDINPTGDVWMDTIVAYGDRVFFRADDGVHGREAWTSDGSEAGTFMVADVNTDPNSNGAHSDFDDWRVGGGLFLFHPYNGVTREWWVTNGTVAGTRRIGPATRCAGSNPDWATISGAVAYVRVCDPATGYEVWASDGTAAGTRVLDVNPGGGSSPENLTALPGGLLAFRANNGVDGSEMHITNGTVAGTVKVMETNTLGADSNPEFLTVVGNKLFFTADDGMHGRELWVTDSSGTRMVADPNPADGEANLVVAAGTSGVFYRYNDGVNGYELWYSDGTSAGTRMVKNLRPNTEGDQNAIPEIFGYVGGKLYFRAGMDSTGWELGVSDGTEAGTSIVDLRSGSSGSEPGEFRVAGGKVFMQVYSDTNPGRRVVSTDGTLAGTIDLVPASVGDASAGELRALGSQMVFVANNGNTGRELWISDGTLAGTQLLTALNSAASAEPNNLYVVGTKIYFSAVGTTGGRELYVATATPGSAQLIEINPSGSGMPSFLGNDGTNVYFSANDGTHGRELFVTAGTQASTAMADINLAGGSTPNWGVYNNGVLYFTAFDGASGTEYWALTGGWSAPAVPTVFRTANAPTAPTPVVRTVPATLAPSPTTAAPASTTEAPFETVAPINSTPPTVGESPQSTSPATTVAATTPVSTTPSTETTVPPSNGPQVITVPANVTANLSTDEQRQLEAPRGQANAMVNGAEVPAIVNRVSGSGITPYDTNRSPAEISEIRQQAQQLVSSFNQFLPAGETPRITVVDTPLGASFVGLLVDPANPDVSIPVPAEFVIVITTPTGAMMMAGLNNSGNPSAVSTTGTLQVTRGGYIGISTVGMPQSTAGQLLVMSTPKVIGEFVTSASGSFSGQAKVPTNIPTGNHSLVVKADWFAASFGFLVTLPVAMNLPATGANSSDPVRYAALFVMIGVAVLFARRRRHAY